MTREPVLPASLQMRLAGVPVLRLYGRELQPGTRKALALALLAALEPGLRRQRAAELLWPEAEPAVARRNVRRDLFRLRQQGVAVAAGAGDSLSLLAEPDPGPAPGALAPRWLDGLDEVAGTELAYWVEQQRQRLQQGWLQALVAQAQALEDSGQAAAATRAWQALLADGAGGADHAPARAALQRLAAVAAPLAAAASAPPSGPVPSPAPTFPAPMRLPFVGRQSEQAQIAAALARGQRVLLDGSPGVGKTRLALEALSACGPVLLLRCRPEDAAVPYASALRGLALLRESAAGRPLPAWVRRDLAALVPEWAGTQAAEMPPPERLRRAYHAALAAWADADFGALLLDDWQWADPSSQVLWALADGMRDVLPCLLAHRSGELTLPALQQRRDWIDRGLATAVHLPPLDEAAALALLQALPAAPPARAGQRALAREQQALTRDQRALAADHRALVAHTGGNPLFLIETWRHRHRLGPAGLHGAAPLPDSVQAVLMARVRALGPAVRAVLELASLAGDDLPPPLLAAAGGLDELVVVQALDHAAAAELLLVDARGRHRLAHDLIGQALADSLSPARRCGLHAALAAALAAAQTQTQEAAEPGRIARHLDLAERPAEAAPWHLRAAERALQRQAWADALAGCQAVRAAAGDPALRLQAWLLEAQVRRRQADAVGAEAALQAALPDAARSGPQALLQLALEQAELQCHSGRGDEALAALQRLEGDPALQPALQRRLLQGKANALALCGRHAESLPLLQQLLSALPASALDERRLVLSLTARNAYWAGQRDLSRQLVEQSLAFSRSLGDDTGIASGLFRLGVLAREQGEVDTAMAHLQQSAALSRRTGHLELLRSALATLAMAHIDRLQLAAAETLLAEGEQAAPFWDTPDLEDVYDDRRYLLHHLRGEVDAAWAVLARSLQRHEGLANLHSRLGTRMQAVTLALATGDAVRARIHLDAAWDDHQAAGAESLHGRELVTHEVHVLRAEGRAAEALQRAAAWLADPQPQRLEEQARLLVSATEAALDLADGARAARFAAQLQALPPLPATVATLGLATRVRLAAVADRETGAPPGAAAGDAVRAEAQAWLAQASPPVLEARVLRRALAAASASPARVSASDGGAGTAVGTSIGSKSLRKVHDNRS